MFHQFLFFSSLCIKNELYRYFLLFLLFLWTLKKTYPFFYIIFVSNIAFFTTYVSHFILFHFITYITICCNHTVSVKIMACKVLLSQSIKLKFARIKCIQHELYTRSVFTILKICPDIRAHWKGKGKQVDNGWRWSQKRWLFVYINVYLIVCNSMKSHPYPCNVAAKYLSVKFRRRSSGFVIGNWHWRLWHKSEMRKRRRRKRWNEEMERMTFSYGFRSIAQCTQSFFPSK